MGAANQPPQQQQTALAQRESLDSIYLRKKVAPLLMNEEEVVAIAEQTPLARWWIFPPDGVVVTSHRIFLMSCGLLSFSFKDFHWEHVEDVHLNPAWFSASIQVTAAASKTGVTTQTVQQQKVTLTQSGLVKEQAQAVYRIAQQIEHEWREKIRQRAIEETRAAASGGVVLQTPATASPVSPASGVDDDPTERLGKLKKMLDSGLISQEEYDAKKAEILSSM